MINVKLMKKDVFNTIRAHLGDYYKLVKSNQLDGSWIHSRFKDDIFEETDVQIEDFSLYYDDNYSDISAQNGIILYEALKGIPSDILYSPYFWAWINFEKGYRQAIQSVELNAVSTFENAWFSKSQGREAIMRGALSREFLKVKMSVDESRADKYELTKYLFGNKTLYIQMIGRTICDNSNFSHAVLGVTKLIYDSTGTVLTRTQSGELLKIGMRIGSVMLPDTLSSNEIENILIEKFRQIYPDVF